MPIVRAGYIDQSELTSQIERTKQRLGPEVVRVKHTVGEDSGGDPCIYFRIVLADWAVREETLYDVTHRIEAVFFDEVRPYENWGLIPYFSFRSQSEQAALKDLSWV